MSSGADPYDGDYLDYQDLTLPLDAQLIFDAPPQHFQAVVYVKRQHELLDAAIHCWIEMARECQTDSLPDLENRISHLAEGAARGPDGKVLEVRGSNWTHQQRLMQALLSVGPTLQQCPFEILPTVLEFLEPMVLDPIQECCLTIEKTIKIAKLYCRQAIKLFENAIQKYHATPGKQRSDGSNEQRQIAQSVFDTKREMCKAIYALSGTLNLSISFKETFILERTDVFLKTLNTWLQFTAMKDEASLRSAFEGPKAETSRFSELMFPPVQFPLEEFKTSFDRYCHSLMLPLSFRDLENLDPPEHVPGQKAGYLFHRDRNGEWSRQYFYILPRGMLMQFSKGKDIQVANLNQTLLRTVNVDSRDFVFEICSIEIYLMESILQASTQVEFEEWKSALFHWHPPDENIPHLESLAIISTPPAKQMFPRPRYMSMGRAPEGAPMSPKPRISMDPVVKYGELYMLDESSRNTGTQRKVVTWKRINCCIRSNGHFVQCNVGDSDNPFETIPLTETLRTHIWPLDGSLFSKKHCFCIKTSNEVNYYTVSLERSSRDQEVFHSWLYALKSYAKPEVFGASDQLEYRLYRTFTIIVNDGRGLPSDLEAFCEIWVDDQKRAKTSTRMKVGKGGDPDAPFWRDSFEFTDLAAFKVITIYVTHAKGRKKISFGRTDIPIRKSEECEGWYPILQVNERTRSKEWVGDLRLRLKCEEQIVLPIGNYSEVLEILLNFRENNVISRLASEVTDLEGFSRNVLRILEGRGLAVEWLNSLIDEEISEASPMRVNTLFRGNTLLTKALDAYMRMVGTEYLDDTLGDIIRGICKNKVACEVDPSKLEKGDDINKQWRALLTHTRNCWRAVTESVDHFPGELLQVFSYLQKRLTEKFSDNRVIGPGKDSESDMSGLARYTGVSGFVFLRLICPAILGPKLFYIVREHPELKATRTLTLIAKALQGLANLVEFGSKEVWMIPMNVFIVEAIPSLKAFIDNICQSEPYTSGVGSSSNSVKSLPIVSPHSPGSTTGSSLFRVQTKNGSVTGGASTSGSGDGNVGSGASTSGSGAGPSNLAPLPSPNCLNRNSQGPRPPFCKEGQHPLGPIKNGILDAGQDLPLLPHLIDLGKELANFSATVARVIHLQDIYSDGELEEEEEEEEDEDDGTTLVGGIGNGNGSGHGHGNGDGNGHDHGNGKGDGHKDGVAPRAVDMNDRCEEDILRTVGRACWEVIHTVKERVELSVELEQQTFARATNGGIFQQYQHPFGQASHAHAHLPPKHPPSHGNGKISREGSREGEFQSFTHEQFFHSHDLEHPDVYIRGGSFDSDTDSFGQNSGHEVV